MNYVAVRRVLIVAAATAALAAAMELAVPREDPEAGRELRQTFLATTAGERGLAPTPEYPKVFAIAMDWPLDDDAATLVAIADGSASVYGTSALGIPGDQGRAPAREAAQRLVRAAQSHFDGATPAASFPYPPKTSVRFYLLGYDGVRYVEGAADAVAEGAAPLSPLFRAAQDLVTELRRNP